MSGALPIFVYGRDRWLPTNVVAGRLGVSTETVRRLIRAGTLPALRPAVRVWLVSSHDLDRYIQAHGQRNI